MAHKYWCVDIDKCCARYSATPNSKSEKDCPTGHLAISIITMLRPKLYIFAKAPIMGKAKTRLARDIGVTHAKRLYRAMTMQLFRNLQDPRWDIILMVTPTAKLGHVPEWSGFPQIAQPKGSLTPRLARAFRGKGPVIVIGTDCPQITRSDIDRAFKAMRCHDVVFGPADDGGFWLMGAMAPLGPQYFANIRWSHEHTLLDMQQKFSGKIAILRQLTDIDDKKALMTYRKHIVQDAAI